MHPLVRTTCQRATGLGAGGEHVCQHGGAETAQAGSHTAHVLVFIHTSPYRKGQQYARSITVPMRSATSDTVAIIHAAVTGLRCIYRPGYAFIKAGVMLLDLHSAKLRQGELDLEPQEPGDSTRERLMGVLDELNQRYGRGTVKLASAGIQAMGERASWAMRQERRSPAYTTCWEDMPEVVC